MEDVKSKEDKDALEKTNVDYKVRGGRVSSVSVLMNVKLSTRNYENVTVGYSITVDRRGKSSLKELIDDANTIVENELRRKVKHVRAKYPIS